MIFLSVFHSYNQYEKLKRKTKAYSMSTLFQHSFVMLNLLHRCLADSFSPSILKSTLNTQMGVTEEKKIAKKILKSYKQRKEEEEEDAVSLSNNQSK
jgi:hypothetical protein